MQSNFSGKIMNFFGERDFFWLKSLRHINKTVYS